MQYEKMPGFLLSSGSSVGTTRAGAAPPSGIDRSADIKSSQEYGVEPDNVTNMDESNRQN